MNSVRLWYKKSGLPVYTSHLDMNRCFTRAVRRADIPLWYTEGFNPHPYMTFLLPLPLGTEGVREPIDIRIEAEMTNEEIKDRLNAVLPEGIEIVDVTEGRDRTNAITSVRYDIKVNFASEGEAEGFAAGAQSVVDSGELKAEKRSKKGMKTVNLCEYIVSFNAVQTGTEVAVDAVLLTGTEKNLNAGVLMDALCGEFAAEPVGSRIVRTEIYTDGTNKFE